MNTIQQQLTDKIRRYYAMGLTYAEIAKLLDIGKRTVQRYVSDNEINKDLKAAPKSTQQKAVELSAKGFTYSEIAKKLKVTKQTVYNWHRKQKAAFNAENV
jgi:DNA invertase Pin-like site-specific DNA recombinase